MALWICSSCSAAYAVGLAACPQCGATEHQEDSMPKINRSGPSYEPGRDPAGGEPTSVSSPATRPPADGGSSSTSAATPSKSGSGGTTPSPSPAPDAASLSAAPQTKTPVPASSDIAPSTDGSTPATTSADSPKPPPVPAS